MDKLAFVDIGELGWSLYLTAHIRWLKKNTNSLVSVICYPDRKCLYKNLADTIINVPENFYEEFDIELQSCFGVAQKKDEVFKNFFLPYIPKDYQIPGYFYFPCRKINLIFKKRFIFSPYGCAKPKDSKKEILIFPRCRQKSWGNRNLPKQFYKDLIIRLCNNFPSLTIRTIGTKNGAYEIYINKSNYTNWINKSGSLQDLIDRCQYSVAAVGSQSAPPKITLLQGVPTFMIGHQKGRHINRENWMKTKAGFYEIDRRAYTNFNIDDCIAKTISFVRSCI